MRGEERSIRAKSYYSSSAYGHGSFRNGGKGTQNFSRASICSGNYNKNFSGVMSHSVAYAGNRNEQDGYDSYASYSDEDEDEDENEDEDERDAHASDSDEEEDKYEALAYAKSKLKRRVSLGATAAYSGNQNQNNSSSMLGSVAYSGNVNRTSYPTRIKRPEHSGNWKPTYTSASSRLTSLAIKGPIEIKGPVIFQCP